MVDVILTLPYNEIFFAGEKWDSLQIIDTNLKHNNIWIERFHMLIETRYHLCRSLSADTAVDEMIARYFRICPIVGSRIPKEHNNRLIFTVMIFLHFRINR